jgi:hypothetical protein
VVAEVVAAGGMGILHLLRVAEILEAVVGIVPEIDGADFVRSAVAAMLVEDARAEDGIVPAHRAGLTQPFLRADEEIAMTLGGRVILPQDRPHHSIIWRFTSGDVGAAPWKTQRRLERSNFSIITMGAP